jgi:hypothetical protein
MCLWGDALTLILLTWNIRLAPNNAGKWQMGFNSAFKGLKQAITVAMHLYIYIAELSYNIMKGSEYCVPLETSAVLTDEYNVMVNSEELIGSTEYLTL